MQQRRALGLPVAVLMMALLLARAKSPWYQLPGIPLIALCAAWVISGGGGRCDRWPSQEGAALGAVELLRSHLVWHVLVALTDLPGDCTARHPPAAGHLDFDHRAHAAGCVRIVLCHRAPCAETAQIL